MLEPRTIDISDREWIRDCLARSDFRGCEYSFANNMAWRRMYGTKIARWEEFYISVSENGRITFPSGGDRNTPIGRYKELFGVLRRYSEENGHPFVVTSVTRDNIGIFEELFGGQYKVTTDEGAWDYVYNASDLIALSGRKYHGKRNHLKKLIEGGYEYSEIKEKDFDDCISFAAESYNRNSAYDDYSQICEQFAIDTYFRYYYELGLSGGVLRRDSKVIAFTIGEQICSDTLGVHIEKADASVDGAYPAINNLFAKSHAGGLAYINREEDLGIEGLRKAKKSYHPAFMIEKYTLSFE